MFFPSMDSSSPFNGLKKDWRGKAKTTDSDNQGFRVTSGHGGDGEMLLAIWRFK